VVKDVVPKPTQAAGNKTHSFRLDALPVSRNLISRRAREGTQ